MSEQALIDHGIVDAMADVMRLLSDPTRLRVLGLLRPGEMNVTALCARLDLAQPTVSHHLGLLRTACLVRTRREGKQVHYSLNDEFIQTDDTGLRLTHGHVRLTLGYGPATGRMNDEAHRSGIGQTGNGNGQAANGSDGRPAIRPAPAASFASSALGN
jgi:DNA-binding transcriptional ArsR family regulator